MGRWMLLMLWACEADAAPDEVVDTSVDGADVVLVGGHVVGVGVRTVQVRDGVVVGLGEEPLDGGLDVSGRWLVPGFIDSHVHVVFDARAPALAHGGVAGAVDWAAPLGRLTVPAGSPEVRWAGPILTATGGYPTQGWGRDGYGLEVADVAAAAGAVDQVLDGGAAVVKVALGSDPQLDDAQLAAIVTRAHEKGAKVGAHAIDAASARRAARAGVDLLVHAPNEPLSADDAGLWKDRAVVSTISAFGGSAATRQLREAGATVLYGTDFGNTTVLGISSREIEGLVAAGLDGEAILAAGTSAPAAYFGFDDLGAIAPGKQASLLVLDADPRVDPLTLARPVAVLHRGQVVAGSLESL